MHGGFFAYITYSISYPGGAQWRALILMASSNTQVLRSIMRIIRKRGGKKRDSTGELIVWKRETIRRKRARNI